MFVDDKAPDVNIMRFGLGGLGLPDRDYYLSDKEASVALRTAYVTMLTTLFTAAGDKDAEAKAATVMALETKIAENHWDRTLRRNCNYSEI